MFPWFFPQPLKKSTYNSLWIKDKKFNLELDLQQISPFNKFLVQREKFNHIGFADFQTHTASFSDLGVLGSCRSLFYKDKYLKGIGLTTLAGHWMKNPSGYHSSGHMLASAALNEYYITQQIKKMNLGNIIVQCNGLLLRNNNTLLNSITQKTLSCLLAKKEKPWACDYSLSAITVKDGLFSRLSNFIWLFNQFNYYDRNQIYHHLKCLTVALNIEEKNLEIKNIFEIFNVRIQQGLNNFFLGLKAGIYWGSTNNNFTIDGRFLDLETAMYIGIPLIGLNAKLERQNSVTTNYFNIGFDPLSYVRQYQMFLAYFEKYLEFECNERYTTPQIKRSIKLNKHILLEFRKVFYSKIELFSKKNILENYMNIFQSSYDLTYSQKSYLKVTINNLYDDFLLGKHDSLKNVPVKKLCFSHHKPEYGFNSQFIYVPTKLYDLFKNTIPQKALEYNENLNTVCSLSKSNSIFKKLKSHWGHQH